MNITDQLLAKYPIISNQVDTKELSVLLRELEKVLRSGATGNIVEFGCYVGTTSLFIRRLLDAYDFMGEFHVYDSFAGLPEKTQADNSAVGEQFKVGELLVPRKTFVQNFKKASLKLPIIHKGWFADFTPEDVPESIIFAFFDGDFYESIVDSFRVCDGKFHKKATIVVDDYANEALPGAARAVDEWLTNHRQFTIRTEASLAIISSCPKT
ncbi:TylF/MycF/NovP-related O-methyltransferase [Candidatus Nanosynbacter sp. TM7-074]|uniref:TylF/MycF/NovP-related O-methyltransferase n=1 Tax=Candidatus Nanosynbacter sp. TM7-074 TaxID=3158573 RepID=A0AB39JDA3_9BACT